MVILEIYDTNNDIVVSEHDMIIKDANEEMILKLLNFNGEVLVYELGGEYSDTKHEYIYGIMIGRRN